MINYSENDCTIKQQHDHLNDGVRLLVTTTSSTAEKAVLTIKTKAGDEYTETHVLHDGKTRFNLSEYFRESMPLDWRRLVYVHNNVYLPFAMYNSSSTATSNAVAPTNIVDALKVTIDSTEHVLTTTDLEVRYGYEKLEPTARLHLFNPNFECIAEFIPTIAHTSNTDLLGYTLFGLCYNRNNGNEIDWYKHQMGSIRNVRQVRLNDYWDDRYSSEGIMLDFVTNETETETISYMVDTRTKGCFLRFLDGEGFLQQILLDQESQESTYEDGDLLVRYDGGERDYEVQGTTGASICLGHGNVAQRTETNCLHCSLTNMPKGLVGDIKALLLSPLVLMYQGKDSDGNAKWEKVRVVAGESLVIETKKALFSTKIDIYPIFENAPAV